MRSRCNSRPRRTDLPPVAPTLDRIGAASLDIDRKNFTVGDLEMTATLDPPPIPGFRLGYPERTPPLPFTAAIDNARLEDKHQPRALDEIVGQDDAVEAVRDWLADPCPVAFLLHGPTGTGKSTMADVIVRSVGLDRQSVDYHRIESGQQDGKAVDVVIDSFRFDPWGGGWRAVIIEEADAITASAAMLWLSALDRIPKRTVLVFTTNHIDKMPDRFLHRCRRLRFAGDAATARLAAQTLIDRVWRAELGTLDGAPPSTSCPTWSIARGCSAIATWSARSTPGFVGRGG